MLFNVVKLSKKRIFSASQPNFTTQITFFFKNILSVNEKDLPLQPQLRKLPQKHWLNAEGSVPSSIG
jgi:hypothetical protein